MNRRVWLAIGVASGLLFVWAVIAFWPSSSTPPATSSSPASTGAAPSGTAVPAGFYRIATDLCAALEPTPLGGPGEPVADHSEKSNYLVYTCERGNLAVSALIFPAVAPAHDHFADVRKNITGATPVADVGAEAFAAGTSLWVYDANLVLMVRFKSAGGSSTSDLAAAAAGLARGSLPRLRS
jgi:hypothetical protein